MWYLHYTMCIIMYHIGLKHKPVPHNVERHLTIFGTLTVELLLKLFRALTCVSTYVVHVKLK